MRTSGPPPHGDRPVAARGAEPAGARAAVVLVHGRGGSARDMLGLAEELARRLGDPPVAWLAPEAAGNQWYPRPFLAPVEENEPELSSALAVLEGLVATLGEDVPAERLVWIGFSQGACLALEHIVRNPRRYGAAIGLSGGLIGAPGTIAARPGSLAGTPVLLGCGDPDPHIPLARVRESAEVLRAMGADVDERIYPGLGHAVNEDELEAAAALLAAVLDASPAGRS